MMMLFFCCANAPLAAKNARAAATKTFFAIFYSFSVLATERRNSVRLCFYKPVHTDKLQKPDESGKIGV
jgi:hypothetical protein